MPRDQRPEDLGKVDLPDRLLPFIPALSPEMSEPIHWTPFVRELEKAPGGGLRLCLVAPVQHGKSTLVHHAIPFWHRKHPRLSIFYATYAQTFTEVQSRQVRRHTMAAGIRLRDDHKRLDGWSLEAGGRAVMTSVDGPGTGMPADIVVVDDPYKSPAEAYSKAHRDKVWDWYHYVLTTRQAPGASFIVIMSRWDEDDLIGRLHKDDGYTVLRLPAIADGLDGLGKEPAPDLLGREIGEALCPWGPDPSKPRDLRFLSKIRDGEHGRGGLTHHAWMALYQGLPVPQERCLFQGGPYTYDRLPGLVA